MELDRASTEASGRVAGSEAARRTRVAEARRAALAAGRLAGLWVEDREDVAQEVCVRFLCVRTPVENPAAWAFRVAARSVRDLRSKAGRLVPLPPELDPATNPEAEWNLARDLAVVLRQLDERSRTLIEMRFLGASHAEIAELLGVSIGSVGTLGARACARAREAWFRISGSGPP